MNLSRSITIVKHYNLQNMWKWKSWGVILWYIMIEQLKLQSSCLSLFLTSLSVVVSVWWRCCCWSTARQVWFLANKRTRRTCEKERRPAAGSCITHWPGSWKQNRSITSNTYLQILGNIYKYSLDLTNSSCAGQNWPGEAFPGIVNFAKISSWYSNNWIQLPHPHPSFQIICTTIINFCLCKFGKVGWLIHHPLNLELPGQLANTWFSPHTGYLLCVVRSNLSRWSCNCGTSMTKCGFSHTNWQLLMTQCVSSKLCGFIVTMYKYVMIIVTYVTLKL